MERPKFEMSKSKDLDGIGKGGNFRDSSVKRSDNGTASDRNLVRMIPQDQSFKFDKYGRPMTDSQMQIV